MRLDPVCGDDPFERMRDGRVKCSPEGLNRLDFQANVENSDRAQRDRVPALLHDCLQLLNLTLLAPEIQEQILFVESVDGVEPTSERELRCHPPRLPERLVLVQRRRPGPPAAGRARDGS